jgi:hypothetical protein
MRMKTIGMLAVGALGVSACGSTTTYANKARPPDPVNLTVYISDSRISVSPTSVGAGPVVFIVTNQAAGAQSLTIRSAGSSSGSGGAQALAHTGPINPQGTAEVKVDFRSAGDYTVSTSGGTATDASLAAPSSSAHSATVHVGPPRPASNGNLLQP